MPDARLQRTRATLPTGYQFGHARPVLTEANCPDCSDNDSCDGGPFCGCTCHDGAGRLTRQSVMGDVHFEDDGHCNKCGGVCRLARWRAPHENAAERIARYQREFTTGRDCGDEA